MRKLRPETNQDAYLMRMASASHKDDLLAYVPEGESLLDYGCGDGLLAPRLASEQYLGYDLSEVMVERARAAHPGYSFTSMLPREPQDNIVFSSVLHEVYAYNGFRMEAVHECLREAQALLAPQGRLLLRDGVLPEHPEERVAYRLRDPEDAQCFLTALRAQSPLEFPVEVVQGWLRGTREEVAHFLNIYTWGWESLPRESQERVNFLSVKQWHELVERLDLVLLHEEVLVQEDYFEHLDRLADLRGEQWQTKMLLVLGKN